MASDIYEELFERMKAGRDALADKYPWFTHDTALGQLQGIRKEGLLPHAVSSCPSEVINWFGEPGRQIVCLHPVGAAGSVPKGFLATTLAIAVDRGKFRWDDRVVDLDPEFQLKDPWVTREFRMFDIMAQRSGLPAYVNDMLSVLGLDQATLIRSLRYVDPVSSFRSTFAYTNITHLEAGRIVAEREGAPDWETCARIFSSRSA